MRAILAVATASLALAAALTASGGAFAQAPQFAPSDETPEQFPAGPGRDDTFYACSACHNFKLVAQQGMTRRQWEESLQWMTDKHGMSPLPTRSGRSCSTTSKPTFAPRAPAAGRGGWQNPFAPR